MRSKSRKDETWYRGNVIKSMTEWGFDVQHHEDRIYPDVPDLSFGINSTTGWIELKFSEEFPKRQTTKFNPPDFTPGQQSWLKRRTIKGGAHNYLLWGSLTEHVLVSSWFLDYALAKTWAEVRAVKNELGVRIYPDINEVFKLMARRFK